METKNSKNNNEPTETKPKKIIRFIIIAVIFLFPVFFILIKKSTKVSQTEQSNNLPIAQNQDLNTLEKLTNQNPTFDNMINLSQEYIRNKQYGKCKNILDKAIELNPNSAIAFNNLGVNLIYQEQYQNAINAFEKAIKLDLEFQLAKNNLKWAQDEKNKLSLIIKQKEQTQANKRDEDYYINLGLDYFKQGDYSICIELWNKVFEINPNSTIALNNIGTAFMMKLQYDDAISMFNQAIKFEPENQLAKNNLAWAKEEKNKSSRKK